MRPMGRGPGPGSVVWRVGGDWTLLLGGGRALILQVAHPTVAAGVGQFSDYESAPWKRLMGTLDLYMRVIYGGRDETPAQAGGRPRALPKRPEGRPPGGKHRAAPAPGGIPRGDAAPVPGKGGERGGLRPPEK